MNAWMACGKLQLMRRNMQWKNRFNGSWGLLQVVLKVPR